MGGFGSSRWKNHQKRPCVEECDRERAPVCPLCQRDVVWIFTIPTELRFVRRIENFGPGCQKCLQLTYFSAQSRGTRVGDLARSPAAIEQLERDLQNRFESRISPHEPPPPEVLSRGVCVVRRWFKERDESFNSLLRSLEMLNSVPIQVLAKSRLGMLRERPPLRETHARSQTGRDRARREKGAAQFADE